MKIRTDFITNSSSSSFIFSTNTKFNELIKYLKLASLNYNSDAMAENIKSLYKYIKKPDELSLNEIMEIAGWYSYKHVTEIKRQKNFNVNKLSEYNRNIIFVDILTDLVGCYNCDNELTLENQEDKLLYEVWENANLDKETLDIISNYYTDWVKFFNKYKKEPYKLLVDFFDCGFIFFESEFSQPQYIEKTLSEYKTCKYHNNHMG